MDQKKEEKSQPPQGYKCWMENCSRTGIKLWRIYVGYPMTRGFLTCIHHFSGRAQRSIKADMHGGFGYEAGYDIESDDSDDDDDEQDGVFDE